MEVSRQINHFRDVVVGVLVVCCVLDAADEIDEVLVCDGEFLYETILLEQAETKVNQYVVSKDITVLKDVEVPLLKVVHNLQNVGPLACIGINYLPEALLVLLELRLVRFALLPMQLLQIVVKIFLEPRSGVTGLLRCDREPGFSLHVLVSLSCLIERQLVQSAILDDLSNQLRLLFH